MKKVKNSLLIILGTTIVAFGITAFIAPCSIIVGGANGLSLTLAKVTGIEMSYYMMAFNLIVFPLGYFILGKDVLEGSLLSSLIYPFILHFLQKMTVLTTITNDLMLACIFAGVCVGTGTGIVMRAGGSTGGMDIPNLILHKYTGISISKCMYGCDLVIMFAQLCVYPANRILYGIVYTFIMTTTIDYVLTLGVSKYKVSVISSHQDELSLAILKAEYGVTKSFIETGITKEHKKCIETIVYAKDLHNIQKIIDSIDPDAFITTTKVTDVKGIGFTRERIYRPLPEN